MLVNFNQSAAKRRPIDYTTLLNHPRTVNQRANNNLTNLPAIINLPDFKRGNYIHYDNEQVRQFLIEKAILIRTNNNLEIIQELSYKLSNTLNNISKAFNNSSSSKNVLIQGSHQAITNIIDEFNKEYKNLSTQEIKDFAIIIKNNQNKYFL